MSHKWWARGTSFLGRGLVIILAGRELLTGQSTVSIVGAGYLDPSRIDLAPGQVTTLFLRNVKGPSIPYVAANGFPLPFALAGLSVSLRLFSDVDPIQVPLLAVRQLDTGCPDARLGIVSSGPCRLIAVTIQVPTGLALPLKESFLEPNRRQELIVSENGDPGPAFAFSLRADNIHVVTNCGLIQRFVGEDCRPEIKHADGSAVQGGNPAQPGETLVVYAFGLGGTTPTVPAGSPAPLPPASLRFPLRISLNFTPNAPPVWWATVSSTMIFDQAVFAGLTPGFAGLYQVNFTVPKPPAGTPACLTSNVLSNVTVTLLPGGTFDGAQFCVQVPRDAPPAAAPSAQAKPL